MCLHQSRLKATLGHASALDGPAFWETDDGRPASRRAERRTQHAQSGLGVRRTPEQDAAQVVTMVLDAGYLAGGRRWHLGSGLIVMPKSVHPERIRQNIDVFDVKLDADDVEAIAKLDREDGRNGGDHMTANY